MCMSTFTTLSNYCAVYKRGVAKLKRIRILILVLLVCIVGITSACVKQGPNNEQQRIDLYVEVMKSVFEEENGGDGFIAIKLDTLEGLSAEDKDKVLESFNDISTDVYDFEDIKNDESKFEFDGKNHLGTINGSVLWIEVEEYKGKSAKITGTSWFGNLGSVSVEYDANYKNGIWELTKGTISIS